MPSIGSLEEMWRRSLDLNIRYYSALGRLTADYLKEVVATVSQSQSSEPVANTDRPTREAPAPAHASSAAQPMKQAGAMVLEGEAGSKAIGVFLVENHLSREISGRVEASSFVDEIGREVKPTLLFDPETVILRSGEQLLVRVVAVVDEALEPDVRYMGQFTIPGLVGTRVPVVLRRGLSQNQPPVETPEPERTRLKSKEKRKKRSGRARSTGTKRP